MKVVLADLDPGPLGRCRRGDALGGSRRDRRRHRRLGPRVRRAPARHAPTTQYGAVHVLCNNAGVGAGAEGKVWDHTDNDWGWGLSVNLWGVIHGIQAFVPRMLADGHEGHVVNTSSGNGGIAPLTSTAIYATTKAAVTTLSEVLCGPAAIGRKPYRRVGPLPGTQGAAHRTARVRRANDRPAGTTTNPAPPRSRRSSRSRPACAPPGIEPDYTPVEAVAEEAFAGIRENRFWILPASERTDDKIRARAASMLGALRPRPTSRSSS